MGTKKTELFHILFLDTRHKSNHHLTVDAKNSSESLKKTEQLLKRKNYDHSTLQILTDQEYQNQFAKRHTYFIYYGEKNFCRVVAKDSSTAVTEFEKRFPKMEITEIKPQYKKRQEPQQGPQLPEVTVQPHQAAMPS
jgi:transcriptional regulator of heat shock response